MASVRKEIKVEARAEQVWAHLSDFQAVHKRVAPGFVVDLKPDGETRLVTFANGTSARELLVDRDDAARRVVYAVVGSERIKHHNASVQVLAEADGQSRVIWTADFLPNEIRPYIDAQMSEAAMIMAKALAK
jgi:carbon monoxide dehydrogenase subunit G